jgi:tetratricopeptide (TPR) repeat protein
VSRATKGETHAASPPWLAVVLLLVLASAVLAIALLARARSERRLAEENAARSVRAPSDAPESEAGDVGDDEDDPQLKKLLVAASAADASVSSLDMAAHALLVRERFEEAEPFALQALALAPKDAEAAIHGAVLRGVAEDTKAARVELEHLARGPAGWEASMFAAGFALRDGDDQAALRLLRRFRASAPAAELTPEVLAQITALEQRLGSHLPKK